MKQQESIADLTPCLTSCFHYDYLQPGKPEFGQKQFMGFIASVMILLAGLRKSSVTKQTLWDCISLFIYTAGLLYLVLMPRHYFHPGHTELLGLSGFSASDFSLNVFGFMPFGYLLMAIFVSQNRKGRLKSMYGFILLIGISTSFLIECIQYYIPGRTSSMIDIAANGIGHLLGMMIYFLGRPDPLSPVYSPQRRKGRRDY